MLQLEEVEFFTDLAQNEVQRWLEAVTRERFLDCDDFLYSLRHGSQLRKLLNLVDRGSIAVPGGCKDTPHGSSSEPWVEQFRDSLARKLHFTASQIFQASDLNDILDEQGREGNLCQETLEKIRRVIVTVYELAQKLESNAAFTGSKLDQSSVEPLVQFHYAVAPCVSDLTAEHETEISASTASVEAPSSILGGRQEDSEEAEYSAVSLPPPPPCLGVCDYVSPLKKQQHQQTSQSVVRHLRDSSYGSLTSEEFSLPPATPHHVTRLMTSPAAEVDPEVTAKVEKYLEDQAKYSALGESDNMSHSSSADLGAYSTSHSTRSSSPDLLMGQRASRSRRKNSCGSENGAIPTRMFSKSAIVSHDPLQFVAARPSALALQARELIKQTEEVKLLRREQETERKVVDQQPEVEWQGSLDGWRQKRRSQSSSAVTATSKSAPKTDTAQQPKETTPSTVYQPAVDVRTTSTTTTTTATANRIAAFGFASNYKPGSLGNVSSTQPPQQLPPLVPAEPPPVAPKTTSTTLSSSVIANSRYRSNLLTNDSLSSAKATSPLNEMSSQTTIPDRAKTNGHTKLGSMAAADSVYDSGHYGSDETDEKSSENSLDCDDAPKKLRPVAQEPVCLKVTKPTVRELPRWPEDDRADSAFESMRGDTLSPSQESCKTPNSMQGDVPMRRPSGPSQSVPQVRTEVVRVSQMYSKDAPKWRYQQTDAVKTCEELHVNIKQKPNSDRGFGFTLKGGKDRLEPVLIAGVIAGSAADKSQLMVGDEVLSMNGETVADKYMATINMVLREAIKLGEVELVLKRYKRSADPEPSPVLAATVNDPLPLSNGINGHATENGRPKSAFEDARSMFSRQAQDTDPYYEYRQSRPRHSEPPISELPVARDTPPPMYTPPPPPPPESAPPPLMETGNGQTLLTKNAQFQQSPYLQRRVKPGRIQDFVPEVERNIHAAETDYKVTVLSGKRSPGNIWDFVPDAERAIPEGVRGSKSQSRDDDQEVDIHWRRENQRVQDKISTKNVAPVTTAAPTAVPSGETEFKQGRLVSPPPTRNFNLGTPYTASSRGSTNLSVTTGSSPHTRSPSELSSAFSPTESESTSSSAEQKKFATTPLTPPNEKPPPPPIVNGSYSGGDQQAFSTSRPVQQQQQQESWMHNGEICWSKMPLPEPSQRRQSQPAAPQPPRTQPPVISQAIRSVPAPAAVREPPHHHYGQTGVRPPPGNNVAPVHKTASHVRPPTTKTATVNVQIAPPRIPPNQQQQQQQHNSSNQRRATLPAQHYMPHPSDVQNHWMLQEARGYDGIRSQMQNEYPAPLRKTSDPVVSVSGKERCGHCNEILGQGAAMIVESLGLYYHLPCFRCYVCNQTLGNGHHGADVRVRNGRLHCQSCYSNEESGLQFSEV